MRPSTKARPLGHVDLIDNDAVAGRRSGRAYTLRDLVALVREPIGALTSPPLSKSSCRPVLTSSPAACPYLLTT